MKHKGTVMLETERLLLRRYSMDDAQGMYANWVTDHEATRFWGWEPHENIEETKALLSGWIQQYQKPDYYHWVIELKELRQVIGYIYLSEMDETDCHAEVHYLLSRKFWNQGLMTEACARVIEFALHDLGLQKVMTSHHQENPASGRVLEKCGFYLTHKGSRVFENCERLNGVYLYYEIMARA